MKSILIVDDEVDITDTFTMLFELHDFKVAFASQGKQALCVLENFTPDVILSDCMMPLMDGLELCARVKGNPATAQIPFILMSASPKKHDLSAVRCDLFLQKPFLFNDLLDKITALLEK